MSAPVADVTVIIAAYNCSGFVSRAIGSALAQTGVTLEVLVIDDASTDDTCAVVEALCKDDSRLKLLRLAENGGPSAARNAGLSAASGEWVAVLDADDAYEPGRLARLVAAGRTAGGDLVADNFRYFDVKRGTVGAPGLKLKSEPEFIDRYGFLRGARPYTSEADFGLLKPVYRRAFMAEQALAYPLDSRHGEDFLLYLEIVLRGGRFLLVREPGYLYSTRDSGLSRTTVDYEGQILQLAQLKHRPEIAADALLLALLTARGDALRRLMADRELDSIVAAKNFGALVSYALKDGRRAAMAHRWAIRAVSRKSRGVAKRLLPARQSKGKVQN
ncbi:MAG: glycosyltransferase family 2 protein [Hyphomicrobiales bacterium]|nr:glycosyltransferase family 2 protein [Hyphomicrobiales bacterium]